MFKATALRKLKIDPAIRLFEKPLEDLDTDQLKQTINMKGWRLTVCQISKERLINVIHRIEAGEKRETLPNFITPISLERYQILEKVFFLKNRGYITNGSIRKEELEEAYECLKTQRPIPDTNRCRPDIYKKMTQLTPATTADIKLFDAGGFKNEEEFKKHHAIYHDFMVNRKTKAEIKKKYGVGYNEIHNIIAKVRAFITTRFVPQAEVSDALLECKTSLQGLYSTLEKSQSLLDYFDEQTENNYKDFIRVKINEFGNERVAIKAIASERSKLAKTVLDVRKSISEERKRELELKGFISSSVDMLRLNMANGDEESIKKVMALNEGKLIDVTPEMEIPVYEKYLHMLSEQEQGEFNRLMEKLIRFHFDAQEEDFDKNNDHTIIDVAYNNVAGYSEDEDDEEEDETPDWVEE